MDDDGWNWKSIKVDTIGWKWIKVDRSETLLKKVNICGWKWMIMDNSEWKWMKVDGSEWKIIKRRQKWIQVDKSEYKIEAKKMEENKSGRKLMTVDESGCPWMKVHEIEWKWIIWIKVDKSGWRGMKGNERVWKWTKVNKKRLRGHNWRKKVNASGLK